MNSPTKPAGNTPLRAIRISDDLWSRVDKASRLANTSRSVWIRDLIIRELIHSKLKGSQHANPSHNPQDRR